MNNIFELKNYALLRRQNLAYPNPKTVAYGIETFGYKACNLRGSLPDDIRNAKDVKTFKQNIGNHCQNICNCNLCKLYIRNLGYQTYLVNKTYQTYIVNTLMN